MEDVMRKLKIAALVLLGVCSAGWMAVASAAPGDCAAELLAVDAAIRDAEFLGTKATTDESNMLAKLAAAQAKVDLNKYSDAVDKLQNISDTATTLANAPRPKLVDASGINGAVATAIGCVAAL